MSRKRPVDLLEQHPRAERRLVQALLGQAQGVGALRRRELYVGMTRARDGLWVGVV